MLASGSYDRVLTLNSKSDSQDPTTGLITTTFNIVAANIPCRVVPSGGNEVFNENQRVALNNKTFAIRFTRSFAPSEGMQIVYLGSTFNIQNVYEVGRREEWMITAVSKDNV